MVHTHFLLGRLDPEVDVVKLLGAMLRQIPTAATDSNSGIALIQKWTCLDVTVSVASQRARTETTVIGIRYMQSMMQPVNSSFGRTIRRDRQWDKEHGVQQQERAQQVEPVVQPRGAEVGGPSRWAVECQLEDVDAPRGR